MSTSNKYQAKLVGIALAAVVVSIAFVGVAHAQSGHFVGTPTCRDIGTQLQCSGKVAGLGSAEFTLSVEAQGTATVECTNPGGNVAPGQDTTVSASGAIGPLEPPKNGQFTFRNLTSSAPPAPIDACPNSQWTATITDVQFTTATITLREGGVISDRETVTVQ